jgi:hypothetical protein
MLCCILHFVRVVLYLCILFVLCCISLHFVCVVSYLFAFLVGVRVFGLWEFVCACVYWVHAHMQASRSFCAGANPIQSVGVCQGRRRNGTALLMHADDRSRRRPPQSGWHSTPQLSLCKGKTHPRQRRPVLSRHWGVTSMDLAWGLDLRTGTARQSLPSVWW